MAASAAETNWPTILMYYEALVALTPSPIVALNRAVALAMVAGPRAGVAALESIQTQVQLRDYYLLPAGLAELYQRLGDSARAAERRFLQRQLESCTADLRTTR